jgi:flagellin-like hook-associated protein FlgL
MSLSIRTNVASLTAQRNLSANQLTLDSSLSRLSSGFRITRAGDDAAGLGISTKLESQIRSYSQATRNANDGLSVVQASEAALNEQANILTRMRELAMQAGSDGVGNSERAYIQKESGKLLAELQRISQVSEYNGTKLLDGSAVTLDFQVGIFSTTSDVISLQTVNATIQAGLTASVTQAASTYMDTMAANGWDDGAARAAAAVAAAGVTNATAATEAASAIHEIFLMGMFSAGAAFFQNPVPVQYQAAGTALVNATALGGTGGNVKLTAAYSAFATSIAAGDTVANAKAAASTAAGLAGAGGSEANAAGFAAQHIFDAAFANLTGSITAGVPALGAARTAGLAALNGALGGTGSGLAVANVTLSSKSAALNSLGALDGALAKVSSATSTSLIRLLAADSDSEKLWMLAMALWKRLPAAPARAWRCERRPAPGRPP